MPGMRQRVMQNEMQSHYLEGCNIMTLVGVILCHGCITIPWGTSVVPRNNEARRQFGIWRYIRRGGSALYRSKLAGKFVSPFHGDAQCQGTEEYGARSWKDAVPSGGGSVDPLMHCPSVCLCVACGFPFKIADTRPQCHRYSATLCPPSTPRNHVVLCWAFSCHQHHTLINLFRLNHEENVLDPAVSQINLRTY